MLLFIILVLGVSLLLYLLMAGADFGAGVLELFSSKKDFGKLRNLTYQAIGPIWEANHIWIILVIVIFFMGFPRIYSVFSTVLHIPILLMLVGIIARGTAFTFRHYDAVKDHTQEWYTKVFAYSSFFTPFFLGICAGAVASGKIDTEAPDFYGRFMAGWLNPFSFAVGLFTVAIVTYLAAVYMIGEAQDENLRGRFVRRARNANIFTIISGGIVFIIAAIDDLEFFHSFFNAFSILCFLASTIALPFLWVFLRFRRRWLSRIVSAFQVTAILLAWEAAQFPNIILLKNGGHLTFYNTAAPEATLRSLTVALVAGVLIIIPLLVFLFKSFQKIELVEK
jgi:cytochrome d ubiquinol oxidase subunit II